MATWDFVPKHMVVENLPPEQAKGLSMNGWFFSAKPNVPWQYKFKVTVNGLQWFLNNDGSYNDGTNGPINARRFEQFVVDHGLWKVFDFPHPHFGTIQCRFSNLPAVPKGEVNANGVIAPFEVELVHHNPSFAGLVSTSGPPSNVSAPIIVGTAQEGNTLTVSTGTWTNNPTSFSYQWKRNGIAISGATNTTYLIVSADIGSVLTCTVTAVNGLGNANATSAPTSTVIPQAPVNQALPVISGTAQQGQTLTVTNGTWSGSPTSYARQWKRNGVDIAGATATTYVLVQADVGSVITCTVTATNAGGSASATSNATSTVLPLAPTNSVAPVISGTGTEGNTLTVTSNGTWANSPTSYTFQWKRGGTNIAGETGSTYLLSATDVGTNITCAVTATNAGGSASATSNAIGPISASGGLVTPIVTLVSAAGEVPVVDIQTRAEYQGYLLRIQRASTGTGGAGDYTTPSLNITHEITPSEIAALKITNADLAADGYTNPSGLWWQRYRIERGDGAVVSSWSNEVNGNVTSSINKFTTTNGVDKSQYQNVNGTTFLSLIANNDVGSELLCRATTSMGPTKTHWELTIDGFFTSDVGVYGGICDSGSVTNFSTFGALPGLSSRPGCGTRATNGSTNLTIYSGGSTTSVALGIAIAAGDKIIYETDRTTNQVKIYYWDASAGGLINSGNPITTITLSGAYIPAAYYAFAGGRRGTSAGPTTANSDSCTANFGASSFSMTPTSGYAGW